MKCNYLKEDGVPCEANAIKGSSLWISHNPDTADLKALAVSRGGQNRKLMAEYGEALEIQSPTDIKNLLAMTISGVWTGKIPANQPANTIGFLARCYLDACEISELEERLNKIESSISKN